MEPSKKTLSTETTSNYRRGKSEIFIDLNPIRDGISKWKSIRYCFITLVVYSLHNFFHDVTVNRYLLVFVLTFPFKEKIIFVWSFVCFGVLWVMLYCRMCVFVENFSAIPNARNKAWCFSTNPELLLSRMQYRKYDAQDLNSSKVTSSLIWSLFNEQWKYIFTPTARFKCVCAPVKMASWSWQPVNMLSIKEVFHSDSVTMFFPSRFKLFTLVYTCYFRELHRLHICIKPTSEY